MFGYTLVKKERLEQMKKAEITLMRANLCYRWFSGWEDLDVIWDYLLQRHDRTRPADVQYARDQYAKERGTDQYGQPLKKES